MLISASAALCGDFVRGGQVPLNICFPEYDGDNTYESVAQYIQVSGGILSSQAVRGSDGSSGGGGWSEAERSGVEEWRED